MEILSRCGEVDDVVLEVLRAVRINILSFQNVSFGDGKALQFFPIMHSSKST
jgi:hypothetical protein